MKISVRGEYALRAGKHFITSQIEHAAVLEPCRHVERFGYKVTYLPVDKYGLVDPRDLEKAITQDTALVTIMHSNNEVRTIQDIAALAKIAKARNVPFHTDAAQSVGKVPCRVHDLGVDFLTVAGHKFYAPKGVGVLYLRQGAKLPPMLHGAGHERGMRPGTENLASIVGLGAACEVAMPLLDTEGPRQKKLGQRLFDRSPRGTRPTPAGETVIRFARTVIADFERTTDELAALDSGAKGRTTVGAMVVATPVLLGIFRLRKRLPLYQRI